ncbi:MAG TPA: bifunctional aldolase/short-chain dehydrogenase [Alphaproteobacteria bacterium]|nr:bifunctional aldolase/short-chain dehydrogenase [Alphaproteobacteria bacterium]
MENRWSDKDAEAAVAHYGARGVARDLALRLYTTRLLGAEKRLVLHGGGNSSLKARARDALGDEIEVLYVKGSGWDMGAIEPEGMPAVRLAPLLRLLERDALSDEDMLDVERASLLSSAAPNPSLEILLHAFLPARVVDHTHANAVLALADQPDPGQILSAVYGKRVALVPYAKPGFALAKRAAKTYAAHPGVEGLVLDKHGIFTFGATAQDSYARMIEFVSLAERHIAAAPSAKRARIALPKTLPRAAEIAPILRGLAAAPGPGGVPRHFVMSFRGGREVLDYVDGAELARYGSEGVATPDHAIRVKPKPLILPAPDAAELERFKRDAAAAFDAFRAAYRAYFARHAASAVPAPQADDSSPRAILVPGVGLFALGPTARDARIAADIAEAGIEVVRDAERIGRFTSIGERETFEMEYWARERAKLGPRAPKPLEGRIAIVTGGASGIGAATCAAFAAEGAAVAVLDLDLAAAETVASSVGGLALACDVTDAAQIDAAFARVVEEWGGLDILVSNAGAAWQGRIGEVSDEILRKSFELNFWAHQNAARRAVAIMGAQELGGVLLFNASKQAVNPGPDFGPYGLPKAATLALMRQYAVDYGKDGIRANAVNADRIRSGLLTDAMIATRAKARGLSERDYMGGNLLGREVTAEDVAQCFLALARAEKTTGAVLTCDGGNIAAALR